MKITITIAVWAVCLFLVLGESFGLMSESSTVANIVGFLLLVSFGGLSVSTGCFTKFKKKKNNEKDNQKG